MPAWDVLPCGELGRRRPRSGDGAKLVHLDFHPDNVLLSPAGPMVIDWTNARRGDPALDVAMTWVMVAGHRG